MKKITLFLITVTTLANVSYASFPVENEIFQAISLDESLKLENDGEQLSSALWPLGFIGTVGYVLFLYLAVKRLISLFRENRRKFWIFLIALWIISLLFYLLIIFFNPMMGGQ